MVHVITSFPTLEHLIDTPEQTTDIFPVFKHEQILKIFSTGLLGHKETIEKNLAPIPRGSFLLTSRKHPIIPQEYRKTPLSAANACIQMIALNQVLPKYAAQLSNLPTKVVVTSNSDEVVLRGLEEHIKVSLKKLNLIVQDSKILAPSLSKDTKVSFLSHLIYKNGPCVVPVVNHAEKKFEALAYHFLMVDWIGYYSTDQGARLAAEVRDPSCQGYYLVSGEALEKALIVGSKVFQIIASSKIPTPDSPHAEDQIPLTPRSNKFLQNNRPPSYCSPCSSPAQSARNSFTEST
jgi:hypothetical protein